MFLSCEVEDMESVAGPQIVEGQALSPPPHGTEGVSAFGYLHSFFQWLVPGSNPEPSITL